MPAATGGRGHLRASDADREHMIDVLKTAFVQGQLTKDEFDMRVGQTLASRTYAELAALTADIPAGLVGAQPLRKPAQAQAWPTTASQSQDPQTRAQAQAEWRALKIFIAAAAVVQLTVLAVGGIVALGTGHYLSGLAALVIGGVWAVGVVLTIAGRILRRRRTSGGPRNMHETISTATRRLQGGAATRSQRSASS